MKHRTCTSILACVHLKLFPNRGYHLELDPTLGYSRLGSSNECTRTIQRNPLSDAKNRVSDEINVEPILALDEEIKELENALIKPKSTRKYLLNVSRLLPQLLGDIFSRNATVEDDTHELPKGHGVGGDE